MRDVVQLHALSDSLLHPAGEHSLEVVRVGTQDDAVAGELHVVHVDHDVTELIVLQATLDPLQQVQGRDLGPGHLNV